MSDSASHRLDRCPRLAGFVRMAFDEVRERWILQAPERVLVLDETSKEILDLCDGKVSTAAIVSRLASDYDAPVDMIEHDVLAVLQLLDEKKLLEWERPDGEGHDDTRK